MFRGVITGSVEGVGILFLIGDEKSLVVYAIYAICPFAEPRFCFRLVQLAGYALDVPEAAVVYSSFDVGLVVAKGYVASPVTQAVFNEPTVSLFGLDILHVAYTGVEQFLEHVCGVVVEAQYLRK